MKKMLLSALAAVVVISGGSATADASSPHTHVTGVVTKNHVAVADAEVAVTCGSKTMTDMTDNKGTYLVSFDIADCPFGSTVKVVGEKGNESGAASGTVHGITTKLNLAIVNVAIPEYGLIGALAATGLGLGAIILVRRQQQTAQAL